MKDMPVPFITHDTLPVAHGFFGRRGGVSTGLYESLNCGAGSDDDPACVEENKRLVMEALGGGAQQQDMLVTLQQIHSPRCVYASRPWEKAERPEADALVTDVSGLALGILTADCGPVLFYGEKSDGKPVIGAAHAGWGGALRGVLENTAAKMRARGAVPESLKAVTGPSIGPESYEVSEDFVVPFLQQDQDNGRFFKAAARDGHLMFDLPSYIGARLCEAGITQVADTGVDTYCDEKNFFSYRRTTHKKEPDYGRQISVIMIREQSHYKCG